MYKCQIEKINDGIKKTGKVILSLGCSFAQGQGAVNDELYEKYSWNFEELGKPINLDYLPNNIKQEIVAEYKNVTLTPDGNLNFTFMEYDNAFVNVLATKYFEGEYTAINLGIRGCGNRATIKDLYFYPEIIWNDIKEIIVIYMPSGLERFDFVNDGWNDHHRWVCMWPHYNNLSPGIRHNLWKSYATALYSEKFSVIEQIANVQELLSWCSNKNAKLIITPGFDRRYNRKDFEKVLGKKIHRNLDCELIPDKYKALDIDAIKLVELFPWNKMYEPDGYPTFVDLVMAQEHPESWKNEHFFNYLRKGSPNMWITPCAHPSARSHDLLAQKLFNHLKSR